MVTMRDDLKIWEDFQKGKDAALSEIYHDHIDFLYNYGKKFTKDENMVLDAIHDVFFELIKKRTRLGVTSNIRLYLLTALRRKLLRILEQNRKLGLVDTEINEAVPEITFSIEEQIIEKEETQQKVELLKKAIKDLNNQQREILYYKYTCGFDYSEICEIMSVSYGTARQLVSRTIKQLKKSLPSGVLAFFIICLLNKSKKS